MTRRYHVDGDLVPADRATVSVRDRGFRYGDAGFETVRIYGGGPFEWAAHAARLERTCEHLALDAPPASDRRERVREPLDANDLADAAVRLSVTRGVDDGGLAPPPADETDPTVVVTVRPLLRGGVDGTEPWDGPTALRTVETRRISPRAIPADAKTHSHVAGVLARLELRGSDADEAVVRDEAGHVAEGTTRNLSVVRDEGLHTPGSTARDCPASRGRSSPTSRARRAFPSPRAAPSRPTSAPHGRCSSPAPPARSDPSRTSTARRSPAPPSPRLLARLYDRLVERRCYADGGADDGL